MTTIAKESNRCSVCGAVNEFTVLASTNQFGSPDLDLRPAPMKRFTMGHWYQECPNCGYISREVSDFCGVDPSFLKSDEYLSCEGIDFKSELAVKFYRYYMIKLKDHSLSGAFDAVLYAAWACDDENDQENAVLCRKKAIPIMSELLSGPRKNDSTFLLMKADILRRAGCFEQLLSEYRDVEFHDRLLDQILAFELDKAKQQDTACYRVTDVTDPQNS